MSPQLGQGANMALLDASTLANCIGNPDNTVTVAQAIRSYSAERRSQLAFYQTTSRLLTPVWQSHSKTIGFARDLFCGPVTQRIPYVRTQALFSLAGMKTSLFGNLPLEDYVELFENKPFN